LNRVWLKRYYVDEDKVILWNYFSTYKVESCIREREMTSTVLTYEEAIKVYDRQVADIG
jgi:hypothetical protein